MRFTALMRVGVHFTARCTAASTFSHYALHADAGNSRPMRAVLYYKTIFDGPAGVAGYAACIVAQQASGAEDQQWHTRPLPCSTGTPAVLCMYRAQLQALLHAVLAGVSDIAIISLDSTNDLAEDRLEVRWHLVRPLQLLPARTATRRLQLSVPYACNTPPAQHVVHFACLRCRPVLRACLACHCSWRLRCCATHSSLLSATVLVTPTAHSHEHAWLQDYRSSITGKAFKLVQYRASADAHAHRVEQQRCRRLCACLLGCFDCVRGITEGGPADTSLQDCMDTHAVQLRRLLAASQSEAVLWPEEEAERLLRVCCGLQTHCIRSRNVGLLHAYAWHPASSAWQSGALCERSQLTHPCLWCIVYGAL